MAGPLPVSAVPGDPTGDGVFASNDIICVARRVAGFDATGTPCEDDLAAMDVNCDGSVLANDIILIAKLAVGLPLGAEQDDDNDDIHNVCDNCPNTANFAQTDSNGDGTGDACSSTAVCGNGILEGMEVCDGDCPTDCNDNNICTTDSLTGSTVTCDAVCTHDEIPGCADTDTDGDGYSPSDGDCCETVADCANPTQVNPGAYEFVGNGVDDDCDSTTSDTSPAADCGATAEFSNVTAVKLAQAMGLCNFTTEGSGKWGVISAELVNPHGSLPSTVVLDGMQNQQTAVLENYGTSIVPKDGATMAGLSTGKMRDANDPGFVSPYPGTNFGNKGLPPFKYLAAHNGSLPVSVNCNGACPAGDYANDGVNLRLTIRVPTNAVGFQYEHRFFSADYPITCSPTNDFYLALLTTDAANIPVDMNIAFDIMNKPISVNNGFFNVCFPMGCHMCPKGTSDLQGTGMIEKSFGGGTKWLATTAPIVPGEIITLELMIFDVFDHSYDSLVLFDAWQWFEMGFGDVKVGNQVALDVSCDDSDGDGVCDANDVCPGADDNLDLDCDGVPNENDCDELDPKIGECTNLQVQYKTGDNTPTDSTIRPHFNLRNTGMASVSLSDVTIRYYFQTDANEAVCNVFACDYAILDCSTITGTFGTIESVWANGYFEVGFTSGMLAKGEETGEIQLRLYNQTYAQMNETNDYSYNPSMTTYTASEKVTAYHKGVFIWGIEPL